MRNCVVCIGLFWFAVSIDGYYHSNAVIDTNRIANWNGRFTGTTFEKILLHHRSLFVDKTMLLFDLFHVDFSMIIRGRNWGKTFNLGMIRMFYDIFHDKRGNLLHHQNHQRNLYFNGGLRKVQTQFGNITELNFSPLKISNYQDVMEEMGKHPVISFSFIDLDESYDDFIDGIKQKIIGYIDAKLHGDVFAETCEAALSTLDQPDVTIDECQLLLRNSTEAVKNPEILEHSIYILSAVMRNFFGRPVVILIDEYDFPLHNLIYNKKEFDKVAKFLYRFYTNTFKKGSGNIHKSIVTGLLRFGRKILSTACNDFIESTILDSYLAEYFGFTEDEVKSLLKTNSHLSIKIEDLELWYDGFYMGKNKMYNPFSIYQCFALKGEYGQYWIHTSPTGLNDPESSSDSQANISPSFSLFIDSLFSTNTYQETLQQLYCNYTRVVHLKRDIPFQKKLCSDEYLSCLTFLGYLTASEKDGDAYVVQVPNFEIREFLREKFRAWSGKTLGNENIIRIAQLRLLRRTNIMNTGVSALEDFLMQALPNIDLPEKAYCDVIFGLLIGLGGPWEAHRTFSSLHYMKNIQCVITIVPTENNPTKNFVTIAVGSGSKKNSIRQVLAFLKDNNFPFLIDLCAREAEFDIFQYIPKPCSFFKPLLKPLLKKLGSYILGSYCSKTIDKMDVNKRTH